MDQEKPENETKNGLFKQPMTGKLSFGLTYGMTVEQGQGNGTPAGSTHYILNGVNIELDDAEKVNQ